MSVAPSRLRRGSGGYLAWMSQQLLADFSGGLNLAAAPSELAPNETPDCINVTLDARGSVVKRLGYQIACSTGGGVGGPMFWATSGNSALIVQMGAKLLAHATWTGTLNLGTATTLATANTSDPWSVTIFNDQLLAAHNNNLVGLLIGPAGNPVGAMTGISAAPFAYAIAAWQNRVWIASSAIPGRVYGSALGDPTTWTTPSAMWVDIREKDSLPVIALGAGHGMDIAGRPGLLAFKNRSCYRIYDSNTGAYTTLSDRVGAVGQRAVGGVSGLTVFVSEDGIYVTDGVSQPRKVSSQLDPLFTPSQLNWSALSGAVVGPAPNPAHVLISLPLAGSSTNNLTLEYSPAEGWIVPHSYGVLGVVRTAAANNELYSRTLIIPANHSAEVHELGKSGSDAGTAIACHYQTPWLEPSGGYEVRVRRARVGGRGSFNVRTRTDYVDDAGTSLQAFTGPTATGVIGYDDLYSLGVGKAFSFRLEESSTLSATQAALLSGIGATREIGAVQLASILFDYVPLGLS